MIVASLSLFRMQNSIGQWASLEDTLDLAAGERATIDRPVCMFPSRSCLPCPTVTVQCMCAMRAGQGEVTEFPCSPATVFAARCDLSTKSY